jgi:hypothetical protein
MRTRRHEVVLVIHTDKKCHRNEAVEMVRDNIHGNFYPTPLQSGVEEFHVVGARKRLTLKSTQRVPSEPRRKKYRGNCPTCEKQRLAGNVFFPPHDASGRCESGGRVHCSCDVCF